MATIAEQLAAARKAKGLTQVALARSLGINRASLANWETGRRTPDGETLRRLSTALDCPLGNEAEPSPEDPADVAPMDDLPPQDPADVAPMDGLPADAPFESRPRESLPETEVPRRGADATPAPSQSASPAPAEAFPGDRLPSGAPRSPKPARWPLVAALVAVVALALCAWRFLLPAPKGDAPPVEAEVTDRTATPAYFLQDNPNRPGRPFLSVEPALETLEGEDADTWAYTFTCRERNGFAFNIGRVEAFAFVGEDVQSVTADREALALDGLATRIEPNGEWSVQGLLPVRDGALGVGIALRGSDDSGQPLSFVGYLPLDG